VNTRNQIIAGNQNWQTRIQGTDVEFPMIRSWSVKYGTFFSSQDVTSASKVVVLGSVVATNLFGKTWTRPARSSGSRTSRSRSSA
jgi:putative ABC transport system permease protein